MGTLRAPRAYLQVNGSSIPCSEIQVTTSRQKSSDTWSASFPMFAPGVDYTFWANQDSIDVSIVGTNDVNSGGLTTILQGSTDKININWAEGTIEASGRDLSGKMMDSINQKNYKNQKSSDILNSIASNHGFSVESDSSDTAGRMYTQDYDQVSGQQSEWQLACQLAEQEGKTIYFKGTTIYFKDPSALNSGLGTISIFYSPPSDEEYATGNFVGLETSRNCQLSKPVTVNVNSWHPNEKKAVTATQQSGSGSGDATTYNYDVPRLTQDQATKIATKKLKAHTDHKQTGTLSNLPGDFTADPRMSLSLAGTGTLFDDTYEIESITFHIKQEEAFTMDISFKAPQGGSGGSS